MWEFIWQYLKEHGKPFCLGFAGSGIVWGNILFADVGPGTGFIVAYLIRLGGAILIAFGSGVATSLAADFYKQAKAHGPAMRKRIKEIFNKINSRNGKQKKDDETKAA